MLIIYFIAVYEGQRHFALSVINFAAFFRSKPKRTFKNVPSHLSAVKNPLLTDKKPVTISFTHFPSVSGGIMDHFQGRKFISSGR